MRSSIALKFIAIFLCAASLLGLIGSAGGILVLTEADLYNKTVDQVMEERDEALAAAGASGLGLRYASVNLGGCPVNAVYHHGGYESLAHYYPGGMGFAIFDAEGNLLESENADFKESGAKVYTYPVTGNYMHFVSEEPQHRETEPFAQTYQIPEGEYGLFWNLPDGFAEIYSITWSFDANSSESVSSAGEPLGLLELQTTGEDPMLSFREIRTGAMGLDTNWDVIHIAFRDRDGNLVCEGRGRGAIGAFYFQDGLQCFAFHESWIEDPAGMPEEDGIDVYEARFYDENGTKLIDTLAGAQPIGSATVDGKGYLVFRLNMSSQRLKEAGGRLTLVLIDKTGEVLFAYTPEKSSVSGIAVMTEDAMTFYANPEKLEQAAADVTIPQETVVPDPATETSEVTEETKVPETTVPETAAAQTVEASNPANEKKPSETTESKAETAPAETKPKAKQATQPRETAPAATTAPEETAPETTEPVIINGKPLEAYQVNETSYYNDDRGEQMRLRYVYLPMPEYTVEIYVDTSADRYEHAYTILRLLRDHRGELFMVLMGSLMLLAVSTVYLCAAAGHKAKTDEIRAGGLNRLPLDLYFLLGGSVIAGIVALVVEGSEYLLQQSVETTIVGIPLAAFVACVIFVGFCFAVVAQCKTPEGYWWKNTLCVRLLTGSVAITIKTEKWLTAKVCPALWKGVKRLWKWTVSCLRWCWCLLVRLWERCKAVAKAFGGWLMEIIRNFMRLLPVLWQWLLVGLVYVVFLLLSVTSRSEGLFLFCMAAGFGLVLYGAHCFGVLMDAAKRMGKGDLDTKVDDKLMVGSFQEFAGSLNELADVVVVAAQKQLRSERMKTELITNVSHDIKTPLTSIINYVDLLSRPHSEEEQEMYLEVLQRQSQRMKKLIDDLMDMSKASTGNMSVDIIRLDAVESVNQALGEFADKLERAQLTPLFRHNTEEAWVMADGRLLWRVLSNLLSNAVKYAMPGTRLYVDLLCLEGRVILSLKNISRDELNVDAEELMERFVRGDDSRNTEGSGLGLNIAKSLMELQKGQLQLLVDGDLFKVTLIFPAPQ